MRALAERAWFGTCLAAGRLLRSARYASVRTVDAGGERRVRKRRAVHAPLLVAMGGPLLAALDTGVRVLPRGAWEERERRLWRMVHGASIAVDADGTLVMPCLAGATLASLLDDATRDASTRARAIALAAHALAAFHRLGLTHGDAMAENVMVDLETRAARWFDFETEHDPRRPVAWRRADDVRALLATCLLRTSPAERARTIAVVLDAYADDEVASALAASFGSVMRRALPLHLGQAPLSLASYREIARLLRDRATNGASTDPAHAT